MVPLSYYEIRVAGVLPSEVLLDFDRLTTSVETVVHGPLQDQAACMGCSPGSRPSPSRS
jgi:hypothetical protein